MAARAIWKSASPDAPRDTAVYAAIAAGARRRWHDLRRGLTTRDSVRRSG